MGILKRSPTSASMLKQRKAMRKRKLPSTAPAWWQKFTKKLASLDPENLFQRKRPPSAPRSVYFNEPLPPFAFDKKGKPIKTWQFATNQLLTARYTLWNFVFKNLWEQYHRVANLFFTLIVVLQFFPKFATISPGVAMLPLLVVLAVTMLKDGYEDWRRHISDRTINNAKTRVLVGGGWINPNVTESKERSVASISRAFWDQMLGGKKRQQKKVLENEHALERQRSRTSQAEPMEPPADAPGGGAAPQAGETVALQNDTSADRDAPENLPLERQRTSFSSMRSNLMRRTSTMGQSEHEILDDGRVKHRGRILSEAEEKKYWEKRSPRWKKASWEDLAVGDFVLLKNNDPIPADIVVCATSEEEDCCYIETKNLDGETNLKVRHAVPELAQTLRSAKDCSEAVMRVDAEPQDTNMYRLNASVVLSDRQDKDGEPLRCPVTINQTLLRGCNIRNTRWVVGLVLMTGADTKIIANSGNTPTKRGRVERLMNPMVYVNLLILAAMAVGCAIADAAIERHFFALDAYWEYLAIFSDDNPNLNGLTTFGNSLITFQNIVPISLYISIEVVRTIQAWFIFNDYDIYYEKTNRRTIARSWNLADDLGQIEYIFSDKTGTLTQNLMIFRECSIGASIYRGQDDPENVQEGGSGEYEKSPYTDESASTSSQSDDYDSPKKRKRRVKSAHPEVPPFRDLKLNDAIKNGTGDAGQDDVHGWFWRLLALCHSVVTGQDEETGMLIFKAQSPDEEALVQAAADVGYIFCGKERNTLKIQTPGTFEYESYELLTMLEFSSARKRMSVIVKRLADDKIFLLTKGADSVIFERSAAGQDEFKDTTDKALEEFANKGLRTLCLAYKPLTSRQYEDFARQYHEASVALEQREERMQDVASSMERDLTLLGSTGIEDRLQDGVPETIADLKRAGIKVWVATGDKLETAIAIGYSTMLLTHEMNLVVVRGGEYGQPNSAYNQLRRAIEQFFGGPEVLEGMVNKPPQLEGEDEEGNRPSMHGRRSTASRNSLVGEDNGQRPGGYALVIDGAALDHALHEEFSRELLLEISTQCKAVICCRVSPLQKALIVRLVKDGLGVMTLAIGDGANDVSMIQAAHVGVGIAGEEGLQAVNSSDYAIAQFRYLKRLLLVHGHWCFHRNGTMIVNFFYKNQINIFTLFWFQIYCGWSSAQGMDYVYLLLWNAFWTVAAVIAMGIFDRILPDHVLMQVPELYTRSRKGSYFSVRLFLIYLLDAVYQSAICFFLVLYTYYTTTARDDGYSISLWEWSTTLVMASVVIANLFVGLDMRAWNWFIFAGVFLGPVLIFIFAPIYASFTPDQIWTYSFGNNHNLYQSADYWFSGIMVIILALMPKFLWRHIRSTYYPDDVEILRQIEKYDPKHDFIKDPGMPNRRAAETYGLPLPGEEDESRRYSTGGDSLRNQEGAQQVYPMSHLHPVQSRGSSIHHDMLTGSRTPVRGYSFSADEPSQIRRKPTLRSRLIPSGLRKTLTKRRANRLSTVNQSTVDEDEAEEITPATGEHDHLQRSHDTHLEPGPEEEDDEEEGPIDRARDTVLPPVRGQMNGPMEIAQ